jgi:hypothetical protein
MNHNWDKIKSEVVPEVYYRSFEREKAVLTDTIEIKFDNEYFVIEARADCCGMAWIVSDDDVSELVGKKISSIERIESYNNPEIKTYLKNHHYSELFCEYYLYQIKTDDDTIYNFILCGTHNGYYSPYLECRLQDTPARGTKCDSAPWN